MSSSSDSEALEDRAERSRDLAKENSERVSDYMKSFPPVLVTMSFLMNTGSVMRLVVGDSVNGEFIPKGHIAMTLEDFSSLLDAGAKHLEKVAMGRIGPTVGSA